MKQFEISPSLESHTPVCSFPVNENYQLDLKIEMFNSKTYRYNNEHTDD